MAGLKTYSVHVNGTVATLRLSDEDAKSRGLTDADLVGAKPAAKARPARAKNTPSAPLNKSRTAAEKAE